MTIRTMAASDYEAALALWNECAGLGLSERDDSREGIAAFLARNPRTCFIAEEEGVLAGTILAGHDGRRAHIYHAAVAARFRGRGIARALVEKACDALRTEGIPKAALVTFSDNADGNVFWERCGFHERRDLSYRDRKLFDF